MKRALNKTELLWGGQGTAPQAPRQSILSAFPRYTRIQHDQFKKFFKADIAKFWDFTGFDVIKFDEFLKTPDGISTSDHIKTHQGLEAEAFVRSLIGG